MSGTDAILTLGEQLPDVLRLVMLVFYLIGFIMAGSGVYQLATAGQARGAASHGIGYGIGMTIAGAVLLSLSGTVSTIMATFYGGNASPEYVLSGVPGGGNPLETWVRVLFNVCVVFGWIASGRGLMILGFAGSRREKGLGAGIAHLIAGVILTNPAAFVSLIGASFGVESTVNLIFPSPP